VDRVTVCASVYVPACGVAVGAAAVWSGGSFAAVEHATASIHRQIAAVKRAAKVPCFFLLRFLCLVVFLVLIIIFSLPFIFSDN
jgi:hypothetical protein